MEVLRIMDGDLLNSPLYMSREEREKLPFKTILELAEELRTSGNGHYNDSRLWDAVKKYRKAINLLEDYAVVGAKDDEDRSALVHTLYSNLAQCYLKLNRPAQACNACKFGLRHAEGTKSVKLLFRFAKAKWMLKDCEVAMRLCKQVLSLNPKSSEAQELKSQIEAEQRKQSELEKKMCQSMLADKKKENQ